jgi:TP901 family phage tail tape measure protein
VLNGGTLGIGITISAQDLASGPLAKVDKAFRTLDDHVGAGAGRMGASFGGMGGHLWSFATGALASFGLLKTINVAAEFEDELAKVKAVTGATSAEMARLRTSAMQAGIATQFSPIEATRALQEIAQAGYSTDESLQLLLPTLDLAAASFDELSPDAAAGLATQALKAFGLEAKDASFAVDQALAAVNAFSLRTRDLPLGLGTAARGAQVLNQSLSETLIALGLVANTMPHIDRASTAVAVAMERLANPRVQAQLAGIGVAVTDAQGRFRDFLDIVAALQPKLGTMTQGRRASFLIDAFGAEGLAGVQSMMTQLQAGIRTTTGEFVKGAAAVAYLRDQFAHAEGTAARFRETMLATFKGQAKQLVGSIQTLAIALGVAFAEVLTPVLHAITGLLNKLIVVVEGMSPGARKFIAGLVVATLAVAAFGTTVLLLQRGLVLMRAGLLAARLAAGQVVVALGPIGLAIAAVAAVIAGFVIAYRHNFGGIADVAEAVARKVTLAYRALTQLFSGGAFSGAVMQEIDKAENRGLKRFVVTMYMVGYRLQRVWDGIVEGFEAGIDAARPAFDALAAAFRELGAEIAGLVGDITGSAANLPSAQFLHFGQVVGAVLGTLVGWLVTVTGWFVRFTSGVVAGFRAMADWIGPAFKLVGDALADLRDAFVELFGSERDGEAQSVTLGEVFRTLGEIIGKILGAAVAAIAVSFAVLVKTLEYVVTVATWVKDAFVWVASAIGDAGATIAGIFGGVLGTVANVFAGVAGFFGGLYNLIKRVVGAITDAIRALVNALKAAAGLVTGFFSDIWDGVSEVGGAIGDAGSWVGSKTWGAASAVGGFVGDAVSSVFEGPSVPLAEVLGRTMNPAAMPSAVVGADTDAKVMQLLHAAHGDGAAKAPTTVHVQLNVDGEVLARATAKANEDVARRAFTAIPVGGF